MYCGDETGAFIGDVGSHTARFGYGGEDCPKVVVPSAVYEHFDSNGVDRNSHKKNTKRVRFSAPVSLMNFPPNDCFRTSPTPGDRGASDPSKFGGDGSGGDVGFIPIYQSLNSNEQFQDSTGISEDGLIQDMDAWACLWEHSYDVLCVRGKRKHTLGHKHSLSENIASAQLNQDMPIDHPLLAVDSTSTVVETSLHIANACERQRALMLETLFESLSAPAAYLAPSAMLSSFSYGRQTALVVDVGHTGTRVTPIVDGYVLKNGSCRSGRGGKWLCSVQQSVLEGSWRGNGDTINKWNGWSHGDKGGAPPCRENGVIPRYVVHSQFRQDSLRDKKIKLLRQCPFHSMTIHEAMYEMITSPHIMSLDVENYYHGDATTVPFCGYGGIESDDKSIQESENMEIVQAEEETEKSSNIHDEEFNERKQYELPDGTVVDLKMSRAGGDLCRIPELLFSVELPSFVQPHNEYKEEYFKTMMPIQHLIHQSLNNILDLDVRKELCSSILLTGASSLLPGMGKKISLDLGEILPSTYKCKVIASKHDVERKYAAWIGGSILSSLGSFQQLWLSRREYDEYGAILGLQRFKS